MMRSTRVIGWGVLLLCLLALAWSAGAQTPSRTTTAVCDLFEKRINKLTRANKHLDAILAATEYERDLLARYPKPIFKGGKFRCAGHGLTFDCPLVADWQDGAVTDKKLLACLRSMTLDRLLVLHRDREGKP